MRTPFRHGTSWLGAKAASLPRAWPSTCGLGWPVCGGLVCSTKDHRGAADGTWLSLILFLNRGTEVFIDPRQRCQSKVVKFEVFID